MNSPPDITHSQYDLFVSYSPADEAWVEGYLLDALQSAGVRVHREAAFALGTPRIAEFERAIKESHRVLLVISPAYMAEVGLQFVDLVAQQYGLESGAWPVIPLLLHPVDLPPRLAILVAIDATDSTQWPDLIDRLCATLRSGPPPPSVTPSCPYPGMRAFRQDEFKQFFGREAEIGELLQRLRLHPLVAVIGASGSGKSSLILAGLIPALERSSLFGAGLWLVRVIRPGVQPLASLGQALETASVEQFDPESVLKRSGAARFLLVIDQFEEVFTQGAAELAKFIAGIQHLIALNRCFLVMAIRADFFEDMLSSSLWPIVETRRVEIAPLGPTQLRAAIVNPAEAAGVYIESALVERLVAGSAGEPGLLPFVQEVMVRLWERLERRFLPLRAYEALVLPLAGYAGSERSGIQAAMAQLADEMINRLDAEEQQIARRIFIRLAQYIDGREPTRRQQPVSALRAANDDPVLFDSTLNYLAENRFVVLSSTETGEPRVDLAHEAMLAGWPRLSKWVNDSVHMETVRRRYEQQAQDWFTRGAGRQGLLAKPDFDELVAWSSGPEGQMAGISATTISWMAHCKRELAVQQMRLTLYRGVALGLFTLLVLLALAGWATLNPVFTDWHVAAPLPIHDASPGGTRSSVRIRMNPTNVDHVYLFDLTSGALLESSDAGGVWHSVDASMVDGRAFDLAVDGQGACLLYLRALACSDAQEADWEVISLPVTGQERRPIALAADRRRGRLAVGFASGQIDLSEDNGRSWRTLVTDAALSDFLLGFSGDRLLALPLGKAAPAHVIDLTLGNTTLLNPHPAWPAAAIDVAVVSSRGRYLAVVQDGAIVDADMGSSEWNPYVDSPPGAVASLTAWGSDVYAVGRTEIFCNRMWTWQQINWWRARLGLDVPCSD